MLQRSFIWITILAVASGRPKSFHDGKIIGGKVVQIEQFPFQVSVQIGNSHNCGGSIIAEDIVVTAGHCVQNGLRIRAGSNFTTKGGSIHKVIETIQHENFSLPPRNDIALLRVHPAFHFDGSRQPIALHTKEEDVKDGALATVSGFGVTDSGWLSNRLRAVTVPVVNREDCSRKYISMGFEEILEDFICGGVPEGGKDSCQGDSGGPFVVDGRLAGIVSYGYKCAQPEIPGVYTNVAYFYTWINIHSKQKNSTV